MKGRLLTLSFSHMSNDMLYTALPPLLPLLAQQHNLSTAALGLIPAAYMISASFLQIAVGAFYDRKQSVVMMPLGLAAGGFAIASIGFLPTYWAIFSAAVLGGVGSAFFHPVATSLSSASQKRSMTVSVFMIGGDIGLALGSLVCSLAVSAMGLNGTLLLVFPPLAMAIASSRIKNENINNTVQKMGAAFRSAGLKHLFMLLAAAILRGVAITSLITYLPLYLASRGYAVAHAGSLLTVMLIAGAGGMLSSGLLSVKFGKTRVAAIYLLFSGILLLALVFTPTTYIIIALFLLGFVILAVHPLLVAASHDLLPNNVGMASALMYGVTLGLANLTVPLVGVLIDLLGYSTVFTFLSALPIAAALLASRINVEKPAFSNAERMVN
ncbi:MAG: MFS transporter [Candidatus Caldarchaeum sp.]